MSLLLLATGLLGLGPTRATDCDFAGGWASREPSECPSNTTQCPGGIEPRCCPSDLLCFITTTAYCCPSDQDCLQDVLNVPRCPDSDWTLWDDGPDPANSWCCDSEMFGLFVENLGVGCTPYGSTLSPTETAASEVTNVGSTCTMSNSIISVTISTVSESGSPSPVSLTATVIVTTTTMASGNGDESSSSLSPSDTSLTATTIMSGTGDESSSSLSPSDTSLTATTITSGTGDQSSSLVSPSNTSLPAATTMVTGSGSSNAQSGSLGAGAIAGIAIGSAAGVALILTGVWFCLATQAKRRRANETHIRQNPHHGAVELHSHKALPSGVNEADDTQIHEIGGVG